MSVHWPPVSPTKKYCDEVTYQKLQVKYHHEVLLLGPDVLKPVLIHSSLEK
jgi:hypothetical protein